MAGSFNHLQNGGLECAAPNLGDAAETIEELYYLVRVFATDEQIREALNEFYRFKRGEVDPLTADNVWSRAYVETDRVMSTESWEDDLGDQS